MPTVAPLDLDGHCVAAVFLADVRISRWPTARSTGSTIGHKTARANDGLLCATLDLPARG